MIAVGWSGSLGRTRPRLVGLLVTSLALVACAEGFPEGSIALRDVTVIDGSGVGPVAGRTVVWSEGRIVAIDAADQLDLAGVEVIDGEGRFLIPALWDAHAHTFARPEVLDLYLANGVLYLRDMGCSPECTEELLATRESDAGADRRAPGILVSGPNIDGRSPFGGYSGHVWVTEEASPESVVGDLAESGSDFIKVRDWLTLEQYRAVSEAARNIGLPVDGHVAPAVPVLEALRLGQRTIEHAGSALGGLLLACSSQEEELRTELLEIMEESLGSDEVYAAFATAMGAPFQERLLGSFDEAKAQQLAEALKEAGTAVVPTLVVLSPMLRGPDPVFDGRRVLDDEAMRFVPPPVLEIWRSSGDGGEVDRAAAMAQARNALMFGQLLLRLHLAGVPVITGTDAAFMGETAWLVPGFSLHDELLMMVAAGLTPLEALSAATATPARVFGVEGAGTIAVGSRADLVLLRADPSEDIRNVSEIDAVIARGELLDRGELDRILERAQAGLKTASAPEGAEL